MAEKTALQLLNESLEEETKEERFPPPLTRKPGFSFLSEGVQPPPSAYCSHGAKIKFNTMCYTSGKDIEVAYRILLPNGEIKGFSRVFRASSAYALKTHEEVLPECIVLNAQMRVRQTTTHGECFASITITGAFTTNDQTVWVLAQGYITHSDNITYPGFMYESAAFGNGYYNLVGYTAPAVGANFSNIVGLPGSHQFVFFKVTLTTSAVAANRVMRIFSSRGGSFTMFMHSAYSQGPSESVNYRFSSTGIVSGPVSGTMIDPLPNNWLLVSSDAIGTSVIALQADDAISSIVIGYQSWAS